MRTSVLATALLLGAVTCAHAATLDFGSGPTAPTICSQTADGLGALVACTDYAYLSQSYGDVAGVSNITYSAPRLSTPTSLEWWESDYNNLFGVAFAPGSDANSQARIEIAAVQPGTLVTVNSFDLGAYEDSSLTTVVNIYAIGGSTPLYSFSGSVGNGSVSATHFAVSVSAVGGVWIEWQDSAWNVGIDNINYTVGAVPEPGAALLMSAGLLGLSGLGALRRRR